MKEITFIRQNIDKWRAYRDLAQTGLDASPADLADAYVDVTSDLSFAQSHFRSSRITAHLNSLAAALHTLIYRSAGERWGRLLTFWHEEVPQVMWQSRRELFWSVLLFVLSVALGVASQWIDPSFCRLILGDRYVEMTLDNIANGEPMGVYGSVEASTMLFGITINNVRVAFFIFASGLLTSVASGFLLFQNGVMLGSFQTFLLQQGCLGQSMLAVWLHGTLEISAIIVAGAAGLAMGNGWLFPGTYSRLRSFRMGARRGLKIVVGTVPVFCVAAFIESFMTRHTEWPDAVRLLVILLSALFVINYYVLIPYKKYGQRKTQN